MYAFNNKETEVRYREEIYSGGALHRVSLTINNNEISINNIKNIKISSPIIDTTADNFYVGTFVAQKVEIQFKNADNINLTGEVYLSINTKIREESGTVGTEDYDDGYEIVDIGVFLIDTTPEDYYKNAKITCYDKSILFKSNVDIRDYFDRETVVDEETGQEVEKITSVTAENLLKGLCEKFLGQGMLGTYPSLNKDRRIGSYDNTKSGKFYISMIAEIMGGNAKIGRDGKLYIIPLASRLKEFNGTSEVVLNNAKARNIETLNIDGNSYQETREGINQLMSFKEGQTSFFDSISNVTNSDTYYYKAVPLADNWVHVECDMTSSTREHYINTFINANKLPNLKTSTQYTIAVEFRNVDIITMTRAFNIGNTGNSDEFFENIYGISAFTIQNKNNDILKFNLSTLSEFSGSHALRNFHTVQIGDKFSYDFRLSVLEGDYTNKDYVYEKFGASPSSDFLSEIEVIEDNVEVSIVGKNLVKPAKIDDLGYGGITCKTNNDGSFTFSGTATQNVGINLADLTSSPIILKDGKIYTQKLFLISGDGNFSIVPYVDDIEGNRTYNYFSSTIKAPTQSKVTQGEKIVKGYNIYIGSGSSANVTFKIQLEESPEATDFNLYKEPIITTLDLQGNFAGKINENTKDRLYIENGNLFLEKKISKIVLDSTKYWASEDTTQDYYRYRCPFDYPVVISGGLQAMCNAFFVRTNESHGAYEYISLRDNGGGTSVIYVNSTKWATADEFKTWLSENNVEVYYELAEPYIVDLGKITIPLHEGYNHIELLSNFETTFNGTYNVDIKETALKINALKSKTWILAEKYKISGVTYENLDGVELVGNKENNVLYIRSDNWFLNGTLEERQSIINDLYNELKNFEMWAVKNENYGDPSLDAWDLIEFQLGNEKYYVLNDNNLTYEMNISTKIETKIPSKQKQEVTNNIKKENDAINKIQQTIDQINGKITTTIEKIGTVEGNIAENSYTKKQINELIQDVEKGLINLFTTSGGNNLLTNTAPYRAISETQLENWEGTISSIREPNSVTKYALKLLNGVASQTIELPNGIYAVGFKYKRLLEGATLKITYNGREINIDANDNITYNNQEGLKNQNGEITSYGEITNSAFTISFECSADSGFEIYELRLVHGDTVTPWTQNQNELKTTSVNIGDGITIESEQANTINKMDTNGMVVTNKTTNKETLVATDEGIITEDLTSKGKSNVSGMLVQRINKKHIFITGIMEE